MLRRSNHQAIHGPSPRRRYSAGIMPGWVVDLTHSAGATVPPLGNSSGRAVPVVRVAGTVIEATRLATRAAAGNSAPAVSARTAPAVALSPARSDRLALRPRRPAPASSRGRDDHSSGAGVRRFGAPPVAFCATSPAPRRVRPDRLRSRRRVLPCPGPRMVGLDDRVAGTPGSAAGLSPQKTDARPSPRPIGHDLAHGRRHRRPHSAPST